MGTPTASINSALPFRVAPFDTLIEGLDYAAKGETGYNFFSPRGVLEQTLTHRELRDRAISLAQKFDRAGVPRGTSMAIIAETSPDFLTFFFACQYAGLLPAPMPLSINISGHDGYVNRLRSLIAKADARYAVGSDNFIRYLKEAAGHLDMVGTPDEFYSLPGEGGSLRPLQKDELSYIQYSSGSTSTPRGAAISQRAITSNARAILRHGLEMTEQDRAASWLPLYHDMGLVGFCLTPMMSQTSVDYLSTQSFARRPASWLKIISDHRSTIAFSPNFGYELCVRRGLVDSMKDFDLSRWRVAGIGGEMIYSHNLDQFAETFAPIGFSGEAFLPCYGQSEATLASTFTALNQGQQVDWVNRDELAINGTVVRAKVNGKGPPDGYRPFVVCGSALPLHELEIRDKANNKLADDHVGHIFFRGPSLMTGYYKDPEATKKIIGKDGWMDTGDLGYLTEGQLVVTGRQKDLIILNGRNIWPQDIERAVVQLEKVRVGDVACFSISRPSGGERLAVVVQCRLNEDADRGALVKEIRAAVAKECGADCEIVLAPTGTLHYTSSGKLRRAAVKADYLAGEITTLVATQHPAAPTENLLAAAAG